MPGWALVHSAKYTSSPPVIWGKKGKKKDSTYPGQPKGGSPPGAKEGGLGGQIRRTWGLFSEDRNQGAVHGDTEIWKM